MAYVARLFAVVFVLVITCQAVGEVRRDIDPEPSALVPSAKPTKALKNHYEALKLYLQARQFEENQKLLDAVKAYEKILQLEPNVVVYKAIIPICFNLDRDEQALDFCEKALALDPKDYDLLCLYGRELQQRGRLDEAASALAKAVRLPSAKDQPDRMAQMCLELALVYEDLKQFDKAASAYENVVAVFENPEVIDDLPPAQRKQIRAEAAKTYEKIGRMKLQAKKYDQAVVAFNKAQEKDATRAARINFNLAEVYLAKNQPEQALEKLKQYLATQPTGVEAYDVLVKTLTKLERAEEIIPALEKASTKDSFNQGLRTLLGQQYLKAEQVEKADEVFKKAWKDSPSEESYKGLASVSRKTGRWLDLVELLDQGVREPQKAATGRFQLKVLAEEPPFVRGMATALLAQPKQGGDFAFKTRRVLASLCRHTKQLDLAERLCRVCLADDPQPGEVYLELCRVLSEAKKYEALAEVCREAASKNLPVPKIVFELEMARSLAFAGKDDEAVRAVEKVLADAKPDSDEFFRARYTLASIYYRSHRLDDAIKQCENLLEKFSGSDEQHQVLYLMSGIYSAQQEHAKSEECLQKILKMDPNDATANNDLAYTWSDQGKNLEEAEKLARKAIEIDRLERAKKRGTLEIPEAERDSAAYIDTLAWVLHKRGEGEQACTLLEQATKLTDGGDDPVIWDHLGDVYQELNRLKDARTAWQKSLELYQTSKRVGQDDRRRQVSDKLKSLERQLTKSNNATP